MKQPERAEQAQHSGEIYSSGELDNPLAVLKSLIQHVPEEELMRMRDSEEEFVLIVSRRGTVAQAQRELNRALGNMLLSKRSSVAILEYSLNEGKSKTEEIDRVKGLERQAAINSLGGALQRIGASWNDITFNRPYKKNEILPILQAEWSSLDGMVSLDPSARLEALNRFTRGLSVDRDKPTKSQLKFAGARSVAGAILKRDSLVERFLDGVDSQIEFEPGPYITLTAVLELSGYPNPTLDGLQRHLAQSHSQGKLVSSTGKVKLLEFLTEFNSWISTIHP